MIILKDLSVEVPDTNAHHWHLEELSQPSESEVLLYGYNASDNLSLRKRFQNYSRKVYFNNWAPCEFAQERKDKGQEHDAFKKESFFDEIYSICPYSNKWLNSLKLGREYKDTFYPFHKKLIPESTKKHYDVIYHGGIHGQEHLDCIRVMLNHNYRYCTMTHNIHNNYGQSLTGRCLRFATNTNLKFKDKIQLIAQTKISVCYNLVHVSPEHVPGIQSYDDWQGNEAFSEVGKWNVMPQFKTRMHEAAISKTINLVLKDSWNIAEQYYEPDREFIYFENADDLENKIKEIKNNWEDYIPMTERAYKKALNYTTQNFITEIRRNNEV